MPVETTERQSLNVLDLEGGSRETLAVVWGDPEGSCRGAACSGSVGVRDPRGGCALGKCPLEEPGALRWFLSPGYGHSPAGPSPRSDSVCTFPRFPLGRQGV